MSDRTFDDIKKDAKEAFREWVDAKEAFREWVKDNPEETEPHDAIHEIADSAVPVYNADLLRLAAENNELALRAPEIGPAFDGTPTPINIIAANIYELVEEALWEEWREIEEEREEAKEEEDAEK